MPAVRTWTTMLACTVALAVSACGGAGTRSAGSGGQQTGTPAEGGSPPPEEVTFSSGDLCDLVLTEQDVPSGMSLADDTDKPNECGMLFNNDGEYPGVISRAHLYADAEEAAAELPTFLDQELGDDEGEPIEGRKEIDAPLGEEGFGVIAQTVSTRRRFSPGSVVYFWRVGNVVLNVKYLSDDQVDEGDALPLAEMMQARAEEF
jgi:hypothetical protein